MSALDTHTQLDAAALIRGMLNPPEPSRWGELTELLDHVVRLDDDSDSSSRALSETCRNLFILGNLTSDSAQIRLAMTRLLEMGRFGRIVARDLFLAKSASDRGMSVALSGLSQQNRILFLHTVLQGNTEIDSGHERVLEGLMQGITESAPGEIVAALGLIGRENEKLAYPLDVLFRESSFRHWLEKYLDSSPPEDEIPMLLHVIRALGDWQLCSLLEGQLDRCPSDALRAFLASMGRMHGTDDENSARTMAGLLLSGDERAMVEAIVALSRMDWDKTGIVLANFFRKRPGFRKYLCTMGTMLDEKGAVSFLSSLSDKERQSSIIAFFSVLTLAAPDFLLSCPELGDENGRDDVASLRKWLKETCLSSTRPHRKLPDIPQPQPVKKESGFLSRFLKKSSAGLKQTITGKSDVKDCALTGGEAAGARVSGKMFQRCELDKCSMTRLVFDKTEFLDVDFQDCRMKRIVFRRCRFKHARFSRSWINQCVFRDCEFLFCDFDEAALVKCVMSGCVMTGCFMSGALVQKGALSELDARTSVFQQVGLDGVRIRSSRFQGCDCTSAFVVSSRLQGVSFLDCQAERAVFERSSILRCRFGNTSVAKGWARKLETDVPALMALEEESLLRKLDRIAANGSLPLPPKDVLLTSVKQLEQMVIRWFRQRGMARMERRMLRDNQRKMFWAEQKLTEKQRKFMSMMPWLMETTIADQELGLPAMPLVTIAGYTPWLETMRAVREYFPDAQGRGARGRGVRIEAVYSIGSLGSVAQTSSSDIDCWVCYDETTATVSDVTRLRDKLEALEKWADRKFDLEVHFFLMGLDAVRANDFGLSDEESSGSAQALFLKEEFYRTALCLAGKSLAWWATPLGFTTEEYAEWLGEARSYPLGQTPRLVDMGAISEIPKGEYFGASLWQFVKAVHSPFKSIMKLGLIESYARKAEDAPALCEVIKANVYHKKEQASARDPYVALYSEIASYYGLIKDADASRLVHEAFTLKAPPTKIRHRFSLPGRIEEKEYLDALCGSQAHQDAVGMAGWTFAKRIKMGAMLNTFMMRSYNRISKVVGSAGSVSITAEDMTRLGRKVMTAFASKPDKVVRLPFLEARESRCTGLQFSAVKRPGKPTVWKVEGRRKGAGRMELLKQGNDPAQLLVWLVTNGVYGPGVSVEADRTCSPLAVDEVRECLSRLHSFFNAELFEVQGADALANEVMTHVFFIPNFSMARECSAWQRLSLVWITNWGELYFHTLEMKNGCSTSGLDILRSFKGECVRDIPEMEQYVPKKAGWPRVVLV